MPTYLILMRLTEHGVRNILNAPSRIEEAIRAFEAVGGRVTSFYAVLGEYDFVSIVEGPSDEIVMTFSLGLSAAGNVRTTSLKAFSREQFDKAVRQLNRLGTLSKMTDLNDWENVETER
jgi:uncharacterized protein with GYD domain